MTNSKKIAMFFLIGVPSVCCLGGVIFLSVGKARASSDLESEMAKARKIGMPLGFSQLAEPPIPADKNAAGIYRKAEVMVEGKFKTQQALILKALPVKATAEDRAAGTQALGQIKPVLDLTAQVNRTTGCNFERKWDLGPALLFPEFAAMKGLVKDLVLKAQEQDSEGDWSGALKSMSIAHRIALDAGSDPTLISMLVEIACRAIVNKEYESLIAGHTDDPTFLAAVKTQLDAQSRLPNPRKYLAGEIAFGLASIGELKSLRDFDSTADESKAPPSKLEASFFQSKLVQDTLKAKLISLWRVGWTSFPRDPEDWQGYGRSLKLLDLTVEKDGSLSNTVNKMLFPIFSQAADAIGTLQARYRLLVDSVTLLQARNRTGKLPVVLPSGLGEARLDPFDGNPMRYRREGRGFVLYSIGRDRVDDGGHVRSSDDTPGTGYDEVVEFK